MKTRCPNCQTTFRVTPEQLKARVGKVRCGQCQTVFNALDSLLDETNAGPPLAPQASAAAASAPIPSPATRQTSRPAAPPVAHPVDLPPTRPVAPYASEPPDDDDDARPDPSEVESRALSDADAQELGKASGLILPRETTAIPGYSKWVEGVISSPLSLPAEKAARWPFVLAALLLVLALATQLAFRFRSEIAITTPRLRPVLEMLGQAFNADIPLPRHVELVSIENSDLQTDPARGNLLVLYATLRNRANYEQAFPSLELSLTDTQDAAIARRIFAPSEYLPEKIPADQPFPANSELAVRLWIEAAAINAAGYRLYVFYP